MHSVQRASQENIEREDISPDGEAPREVFAPTIELERHHKTNKGNCHTNEEDNGTRP